MRVSHPSERRVTPERAGQRARAEHRRRRRILASAQRRAAELRHRSRAAAAHRRRAATHVRTYEEALESADRAAAREPLAPEDVNALLEESLAIVLPDRQFSEEEYGRLTDSVLRIRAARRALKEVPLSRETARFVERQRQEITDALATFEAVAGIAPSRLPDVLDPGNGINRDDHQEEDDADVAGEPLSDYPPQR